MPGGKPNVEYYRQPVINKPLEKIYADIDAWTFEIFEGDEESYYKTDLTVLLPPLFYQGKFLKGLCFTRAADLLLARHTEMAEYFVTIASSMCSGYPWSKNADAYFATYNNDYRDSWFRQTNPNRANKTLIPLADADYTHEFLFQPVPIRKKSIDVLTVSRLDDVKNLSILCQAILVYSKKYKPIKMTIAVGRPSGNWKDLTDEEQEELSKIHQVFGGQIDEYIDLVANVPYCILPHYYSCSRICVLGSLIEGANRSLKEAMCCNTPVLCFKDLNRYTRGEDCIFPAQAGLSSEFDAEALCDAIHLALSGKVTFEPRQEYLQERGRCSMFNSCLDAIPYFQSSLEDYSPGCHEKNSWLNGALQQTHQVNVLEWIYAKSPMVHASGLEQIDSHLSFFLSGVKL